jgi:hypothetical protein
MMGETYYTEIYVRAIVDSAEAIHKRLKLENKELMAETHRLAGEVHNLKAHNEQVCKDLRAALRQIEVEKKIAQAAMDKVPDVLRFAVRCINAIKEAE